MSKDKSPERLPQEELQMGLHLEDTLDLDVDLLVNTLLYAYPDLRVVEPPKSQDRPVEERFKDVPVVRTVIDTAGQQVEHQEAVRQKDLEDIRRKVRESYPNVDAA